MNTKATTWVMPAHIAAAVNKVDPLTLEKGQAFADELFVHQPNLLAGALVLSRLGVSNDHLNVVLRLLFICYQAARETNRPIAMVSEASYEQSMVRLTARINFSKRLSIADHTQVITDYITGHSEPNLLAVVFNVLETENLLSVKTEPDKYLVLSVLNTAEVLAEALSTN
jgi:hypothetical protein